MGLLLNGEGDTVTKDTEKAEVLNAFFTSVFTNQASLKQFLAAETRGEFAARKTSPWWKSIKLENINKPDTHKCTGHDEMTMTDAIERPLLIVFERLRAIG